MGSVLTKRHQAIYFFANPVTSAARPNPPARGLSSSSNGNPNAVEGKRIITWAKVALSKPVRSIGIHTSGGSGWVRCVT